MNSIKRELWKIYGGQATGGATRLTPESRAPGLGKIIEQAVGTYEEQTAFFIGLVEAGAIPMEALLQLRPELFDGDDPPDGKSPVYFL